MNILKISGACLLYIIMWFLGKIILDYNIESKSEAMITFGLFASIISIILNSFLGNFFKNDRR